MEGAAKTGIYRNLFAEAGYQEAEIEQRINDAFQTVFYDPQERFYFEAGEDMGYFEDTGNFDARTEGMSYAMMICVQLDKKEEFDRVWKWTKTHMFLTEGYNKGYFAWSCQTNGTKNADGPAPDGEEFFAMALFFASHRWGDGEGIFEYSAQAREILHACLHNPLPMWELEQKLIKFVPGLEWSDPSYHLPHFYELFAKWANEADRPFWAEAAQASRAYLKKACHPVTGLAAEYANYDGTPYINDPVQFGGKHQYFFSDSYRVAANLGLDYLWFAADPWEAECAGWIQRFFCETVGNHDFMTYQIDGTVVDQPALHPVAIIATNAMAGLAASGGFALSECEEKQTSAKYVRECLTLFWNTPLRKGERRYYDNCLYLFSLLALSGKYRIY